MWWLGLAVFQLATRVSFAAFGLAARPLLRVNSIVPTISGHSPFPSLTWMCLPISTLCPVGPKGTPGQCCPPSVSLIMFNLPYMSPPHSPSLHYITFLLLYRTFPLWFPCHFIWGPFPIVCFTPPFVLLPFPVSWTTRFTGCHGDHWLTYGCTAVHSFDAMPDGPCSLSRMRRQD